MVVDGILEKQDWIHVAQNSDQWWAIAKTIINLQIP